MFIKVIDRQKEPDRACWDNDTIYWKGAYYAMCNIATRGEHGYDSGYAVDIHRSEDGVHWSRILKDAMPLKSAHAGFSFHCFGNTLYYHPTCTTPERGIHFKTYRSYDMLHWEHMGDEYDVLPDARWYRQRWDEMQVLDDVENGTPVYYGYISSEVREEVGAPSCGLLKSYDGLHWKVLPPPVIEWGHLPAQHMEVSFCEKIGNKYYLCLNGRLYLDSLGYSLFIFVADRPEGPFFPDESMFRLCGNSNTECTWLTHTALSPDGLLCATWLSHDTEPSIPSRSFTVAPLAKLCSDEGHLRLRYWAGNEAAKGDPLPIDQIQLLHPLPQARKPQDLCQFTHKTLHMEAGRDGVIGLIDGQFDAAEGFVLEGTVQLRENRTAIETHHHAAWFGVFLESGHNQGTVMAASTHAGGVTGTLRFADRPIGSFGLLDDQRAAQDLHTGRSGALRGLIQFQAWDHMHAIGQANAPDLRHGRTHTFRLIARGDFFQLYIDDWYVQTGTMPEGYTGRVGLLALDGTANLYGLRAWQLNIEK